ncbi:hypothetical protein HPQ64_16615 [Rhizobiales bacterium]|uniref:DUF6030 family protein n=1 Tax=Hongsoonwoonella zoysiae TaxID=2821844 RepID=UPI00155F7626|nr:DUF6030 family protein [Hongsoonwoonella zoysiae]NRG19316.1 hypothetical protein [Hongsoonwoonella zoysiae]
MRSSHISDETGKHAWSIWEGNRHRQAAVAAALAVAVVASIAAGWWLAGTDEGSEVPGTGISEKRVRPAPDPLAGLPEDARKRLTDPAPDKPDLFKLVYGGHPRDLCAAFEGVGVPMSAWTPDPLRDGGWQCSSELVAVGKENGQGGQSTIFVSLRGASEDRLGFLRVKLNGDNPDTLSEAKAATREVLDQVAGRYGWEWPSALYDALSGARSAEIAVRGAEIKVRRERSDLVNDGKGIVRLNVVIDFPHGAGSARGENFTPFDWEDGERDTPFADK